VVPAVVAVVAAAMALASPLGTLSSNPLAGPLGYGNAKAALYFQAAVAALTLAVLARNRPVRFISVGAAGLFALVPWITGSVAVALATLLLPVGWLASRGPRPRRWALIAVVPFLLVLGATTLLAADPPSEDSRLGEVLDAALDRERLVLWHEAIAMIEAEPVLGVGPGRFDELSPSARRDSDLWWAHHGFLQQGAETGVPGAALLVATFAWGFVRLGRASGATRAAPFLAIGVLALGLQACVDYVLHFPAVVLAASALVGVPPTREGSA
jgi:O-antigen ligase